MRSSEQREPEKIEEMLGEWAAALQKGDIETLAGLVTEDAEFWAHGAAPLVGRQGLKKALQPFFDAFHAEQDFECHEIWVAGELAFMRGMEVNRLLPRAGGEHTTRRQRAFSVLRRGADGKWRFARGMTNVPPEEVNRGTGGR